MLDLSSTKKWPVDDDGLKYVPIKRNYLLRLGIHAQAAERMSAYRAVVRLESDDAISLELTSEKSCEQEILAISPGSRAAADFAREMRAWARRMPSGAETTAEPELEWKTTPSSLETNLTVRFLRAAGIPTTLMPPALALTYRRRRGNAPDEASPSYISVHAGSRTPFRYVITVEPGESANDAIAENLWTDAKAVLELDTRAWDEREQITRSVASQIAVNLQARGLSRTRDTLRMDAVDAAIAELASLEESVAYCRVRKRDSDARFELDEDMVEQILDQAIETLRSAPNVEVRGDPGAERFSAPMNADKLGRIASRALAQRT